MKKSLSNTNNKGEGTLAEWLTAFLLYLSLFPYFIWRIEPLSLWFISIPLLSIFVYHVEKYNRDDAYIPFMCICVLGAFCGGSNILGVIMMASSAIVFVVNKPFMIRVYKRYRFIFVSLISLSLIVFLLVSFGVGLPYHYSPPPPRNTIDYGYYIFPFYACPSVDDWRYLGLNRFNGLFDEPGVVGTISFVLLFIDKFNLKRVGNLVLFVSGVLSFSLFFYIASFLYFCYFVFFERTNIKTKLVSSLLIILCVFQFVKTELYGGYIGDRLLWDKASNTIVGDDRSGQDMKNYMNTIRGTTAYFWGAPDVVARFQSDASLEKQVLQHGFITVVIFFIFFAAYSLRYLRFSKEWVLFYLFFCAILYNRPTMFAYDRLFLYCIMIFALSSRYQRDFHSFNTSSSPKDWFFRHI